uniref:Uncharacterized protein n=1 Tax=Rhizophora mucronata TaxID=61149 RepID=A0A2P2M5A0_RHIMU
MHRRQIILITYKDGIPSAVSIAIIASLKHVTLCNCFHALYLDQQGCTVHTSQQCTKYKLSPLYWSRFFDTYICLLYPTLNHIFPNLCMLPLRVSIFPHIKKHD